MNETPRDLALFLGAHFEVVGTDAMVPLFADGQQRFKVVTNSTTNRLVDALAIKLSAREISELGCFGMYDVASITRPRVRERVVMRGFPRLGVGGVDATGYEADVERVEGLSIVLSRAGVPGMSGGPVESKAGLVGLIKGDFGTAPNLTNALVISFDVVAAELFR